MLWLLLAFCARLLAAITHSSWCSDYCSHSVPDFWQRFCWISRSLLNETIAPESRLPNHTLPTRHSGHYTLLFPESFRRWVVSRSGFEKLIVCCCLEWILRGDYVLIRYNCSIDYSHLKIVWPLSQNQCDVARFSFVDILFGSVGVLKIISTKEPPAYED